MKSSFFIIKFQASSSPERSESTGSLDSYCGKFVEDILLRLSFEKEKSKSPTLVEVKNLTYTIADEKNLTYTIERSYSNSSGRSVCVKLVDEVFHLSTLEKESTPLPSISSRNVSYEEICQVFEMWVSIPLEDLQNHSYSSAMSRIVTSTYCYHGY